MAAVSARGSGSGGGGGAVGDGLEEGGVGGERVGELGDPGQGLGGVGGQRLALGAGLVDGAGQGEQGLQQFAVAGIGEVEAGGLGVGGVAALAALHLGPLGLGLGLPLVRGDGVAPGAGDLGEDGVDLPGIRVVQRLADR